MSPISAVLFDMDGVVVDSERYWVELEEERIFPSAVDGEVSADEITGMNYREIYDYLDSEYGATVEKDEFVATYDETAKGLYGDHVSLMDGFRDLCSDLRDRGVDVALVSSSPRHWIRIVLDRFDLDFAEVVSAEDIDVPGKPEPAIYEHAAAALDRRADECAAVEDSENGVKSATSAGMYCIGYRNQAKDLDLSAADAVVSDAGELREELLSLPAPNGSR